MKNVFFQMPGLPKNIDGTALCCQGLVRSANQDRADCFVSGTHALAFVADGMGGHYGGEQASETVDRKCRQWWKEFSSALGQVDFARCVETLRALLLQCHEEIRNVAPPGETCGSTVVLLFLSGGEYALFSAGDSRCYQISRRFGFPGQPEQMTCDDVSSIPGFEGRLTRALGPGSCELTLRTGQAKPGTVFALCSDGIHKFCPNLDRELKNLPLAKRLEDAAGRIAAQVDEQGAPDNYSLVLLRV